MPPQRLAKKRPLSDNAKNAATQKKPAKRVKRASLIPSIAHPNAPGIVLVLGQGNTGQLGLGEDIMERRRPSKIEALDDKEIVQVEAGGMHTLCLTKSGTVYSFGCNDEGALGRDTSEDGSEFVPGVVEFSENIAQICTGDSHSAALTRSGKVYIWGVFRDSTGQLGLVEADRQETRPIELQFPGGVMKISCGVDHIACLMESGDIYTMGNAQQGQLGRLASQFCSRDSRRGIEPFLQPLPVRCLINGTRRRARFSNVWTGAYSTFAQEKRSGDIYAWGLNNYSQLGFNSPSRETVFRPEMVYDLEDIKEVSGGQHHTLAVTNSGDVLSFGRHHYGRTGLPDITDTAPPTKIPSIAEPCMAISAGNVVSFVVTESGAIYSFGFGTNLQLSTQTDDPEEDVWIPGRMIGKQLENRFCLSICGGGQHTVILAKDKNNN